MNRIKIIVRKDKKTGNLVAFFPDTLSKTEWDGKTEICLLSYEYSGCHCNASLGYYRETLPLEKTEDAEHALSVFLDNYEFNYKCETKRIKKLTLKGKI